MHRPVIAEVELGAGKSADSLLTSPVVVPGRFDCDCVQIKAFEVGRDEVAAGIGRTEDALGRFILTVENGRARVVDEKLRVVRASADHFAGFRVGSDPEFATRVELPRGCLDELVAALHGLLLRSTLMMLQCREFDLASVVGRSVGVPTARLELGS